MPDIIAGIVEDLRTTAPFHSLPATTRPHKLLWTAYNNTLLALRMPLYHQRLGKPRPKPKAYEEAVQMGLAILACFAFRAEVQRAIVRIEDGAGHAISFQPRPWMASWTAEHALDPQSLCDPTQDPMTEHGMLPQVSTADMLHLSCRVALAFAKAHSFYKLDPDDSLDGTATFEFLVDDWNKPAARIVYRPYGYAHLPAQIDALRSRA